MPLQHQTLIGLIRAHVHAWRREQQWSNETMGQCIVDAHERLNGPALTGIVFEPKTQDTFTRQRVNGERICRWLDDDSKSNNLLPANFIPSILSALPMTQRAALVEALLHPLGLGVRVIADAQAAHFDVLGSLRLVMTETSEAQQALVDCADGATQAELDRAAKELREAGDAIGKSLEQVERARLNRQLVAVK